MIKLVCIVDNTVRKGSGLGREWGLAFVIATSEARILMDTGATSAVLLHNLQVLDIDPATIDVLTLSHAHWDHTGGLRGLLPFVAGKPLYANSDLFRKRFAKRQSGFKSVGMDITEAELRRHVNLCLSNEPQEIVPEVWTTGEIVSRTEPEGHSPNLYVQESSTWRRDPYKDDLSLVLKVDGGLVLLCGCCHAGLLNTLAHVRARFEGDVIAVVGGVHLVDADEAQLVHVVEVLRGYGPPALYLNHCSGDGAIATLRETFGDEVQPCPAGTVLTW